MDSIIEVNNLNHSFGEKRALNDLTFSVQEGEVFGVLGPNGAGKTTTVRVLNGVLAPSSGQVKIMGMNPVQHGPEVRVQTGVLTETPSLYERLSGRDNLLIFGALYGVPENILKVKVDESLAMFGLSSRGNDLAGAYSKGMKQRLALARAFLHQPRVLFLDEPTSALDPEAARNVTGLIEELSSTHKTTIFLCTHNLDEAERLCDRVAVLNQGRLMACGSIDELSRTLWQGTWIDFTLEQPLMDEVLSHLQTIPFVREVSSADNGSKVAVYAEAPSNAPDLVEYLVGQKARILSAAPRKHTLEEIYFTIGSEGK
jgi:ABC-2 type transport system ATP-binding protein